MLEFKPLILEDKEIFDKYLKPYTFLTCEYSFTNLYIWRKASDIQYTIFMDSLIIKQMDLDSGYFFMQPIGYKEENLKDIIEALIEYRTSTDMRYLFKFIEEPFREKIEILYPDRFLIEREINNFDYIYESQKLIDLPGRKLASKRNHIHKFLNTYKYRIANISPEITDECIATAKDLLVRNQTEYGEYLIYELESIRDLLKHSSDFDFVGMGVYVDDKLSAFTIGEKVNEDMAIIHIEKAHAEINGLYTFINKTFVENYFSDVPFINREDDMGLEGLRSAKQSYHPYKLEYKYMIS